MPPKRKNNGSNTQQLQTAVQGLTEKISSLKVSKSARKRANRRLRQSQPLSTMNTRPGNMGNVIMSQATDTGLRRLRVRARPPGLSDQGVSFLKCAFAPPDFQQNSIAGVPDDYRGPSLTRKHRYVAPITLSAAVDYYIILAPVPGVAYFLATTVAGAAPIAGTVWNSVNYADAAGMFGGSANTADNVTKFRYVSNHIEVIPTVNQMTWSGNIQAWKIPLNLVIRQGGATTSDLWAITGLQSVNSTLQSAYTGPFIMGLYTACYNGNGTFPFSQIIENVGTVPATLLGTDFGVLTTTAGLGFTGLDNQFESMVIKISGITANQTALFKTWACVEYQVNANSTLYEFQSLSPCDPVSIELYREIIQNLPVGVSFEDNENFWNRVLTIIREITGVAGLIPGPYGMIARGANLLSSGALSLLR